MAKAKVTIEENTDAAVVSSMVKEINDRVKSFNPDQGLNHEAISWMKDKVSDLNDFVNPSEDNEEEVTNVSKIEDIIAKPATGVSLAEKQTKDNAAKTTVVTTGKVSDDVPPAVGKIML